MSKRIQSSNSRVTLADVAAEAGVSVQTVSHVLSDTASVRLPESTRQRVVLAAEKVGYRPNRIAQAMKSGRSNVVAVWMSLDRVTANHLRALRAITTRAEAAGYNVMITALDNPRAHGAEPITRLPDWPVDGVFAVDAGPAIAAFRADKSNLSTPVVVMGTELYENGDAVGFDVYDAAKSATLDLIKNGCREVAHVTLKWVVQVYPEERRHTGYLAAMKEAGLQPLVIEIEEETRLSTASALSSFLDEHRLPEGIVAFSDGLAINVARVAFGAGYRIPDDCRIWGYGNLPESEDYRVPISTVQIPVEQIVNQSWTWLMERIENGSLPSRSIEFPMELIERESSR
ncbi:MAG: LacI family DNA-binding transcriptional regulator [Chthonomonas sp.]|nr:LacI family DNA-binding transcriptional regulator [Chthonomonas sp.]